MKTQNVIKWEKTGLLKYLRGQKKTDCADLLENVANILIKNYEGKTTEKSENICGLILPITRKLFDKKITSPIPTAEWLFDDFLKFFDENYSLYKGLDTHFGIDVEGDMCEKYVEKFCGIIT